MFSTPTTPTLTPTLKNISEVPLAHEEHTKPLVHEHQGGFVPPTIDFAGALRSSHPSLALGQENMSSNSNFCSSLNSNDEGSSSDETDSYSNDGYSQGSQSNDSHAVTRGLKNGAGKAVKSANGGKSSRKNASNTKVTPEEEAKKKIRRERNKQAAARCRKRRLDHTNELTKQTEDLDKQKVRLEQEFEKEQKEYERFKAFLDEHKKSQDCKCRQETHIQPAHKTSRPQTLAIKPQNPSLNEPLVPLSTPSSILPIGTLLENTGLTPLLQTPSAGGFMPGVSYTNSGDVPATETVQSSNQPSPSKFAIL